MGHYFQVARQLVRIDKAKRTAPLIGMAGLLALALPSSGLAVVSLTGNLGSVEAAAIDLFTPSSVDPELAARVADISDKRGFRFTPAGANIAKTDRTVTVAVRVDEETAKAITVRTAVNAAPGKNAAGIAGLQTSRYNLGTARGYQSFARTTELPKTVRDLKVPDLAEFKPAGPTAQDKPSRLQPRIALEDKSIAGRSPNTMDASEASVDVGGSFRLSRNLDVTAGVRLSQERDRLGPLTSSQQDSQAVYVGTQLKF